jgi:S-adenosyl methyltransferase
MTNGAPSQEDQDVASDDAPPGLSAEKGVAGLDTGVAHPARIWDYMLGGKDNFAADREAGEQVMQATPAVAKIARADRAFLARAVHYLAAECGVRQFLDIGTGLPTANNTHEVAQRAAPDSRIVYVDNDPIVLAHARALLTSGPEGATAYLDADAREPGLILERAADTLDFSQPVAVMLLGILLFVPDEQDPWSITATLMAGTAPGSYLAITHGASDIEADAVARAGGRYNEHSAVPLRLRPRDSFARFFDGLDLVYPGIVPLNHWDPHLPPSGAGLPAYGAVGRKP